jgi:DNA-binding IscR family transcriptional regulator
MDPKDIRLAQVMRLIDGPIALLPCVSLNFYERCVDCDEKKCGLKRVMIQVRDNTLTILENKTVADLTIK